MATLVGESDDPGIPGVHGIHSKGEGGAAAIIGQSEGRGVLGVSEIGQGVWGQSVSAAGVVGVSETFHGVSGGSKSGPGVVGTSDSSFGVFGASKTGPGVEGKSESGHGVVGQSTQVAGVVGVSENSSGVECRSTNHIGVVARGGRLAGFFEGDVEVTGDIRLANADCAEDFDLAGAESVEPGTVMVLGEAGGTLRQSRQVYDKRVAGVISGAGGYKPGIVLDKQNTQANRVPLALLGKVYCKVDASFGPIEVGDLLTTSDRPGHAMKAADPLKAFGSIIGKALQPLKDGQGLIPILIALQ